MVNNCHYCQQLPELSNASNIVKSYCIVLALGTVFVIAFVSVFVFLLVCSYDHHASSLHHCDQISHTSLLVFSLTTKKRPSSCSVMLMLLLIGCFLKRPPAASSCATLRAKNCFNFFFCYLHHQCLHFTSWWS